jgi:hypothetical protein
VTAHLSRVVEGDTLMGRCSICGDKRTVPNKGLGRATLAAWESQHQHYPEVPTRLSRFRVTLMTEMEAEVVVVAPENAPEDVLRDLALRALDESGGAEWGTTFGHTETSYLGPASEASQ